MNFKFDGGAVEKQKAANLARANRFHHSTARRVTRHQSEANTLRLNSDTRAVRLWVVFKSDDYRNYSAAITTIEGTRIWQKTLKADTSEKKQNRPASVRA